MNPVIELINRLDSPDYNLNPPASDSAIQECEAVLGVKLPRDYIEFLRFTNGAELPLSHELFGTVEIDWGIGNLTESRQYKNAKGLPQEFLLFHDDGRDCHAFLTTQGGGHEIQKIVQWDAGKQSIVRECSGLRVWLDQYIIRSIAPYLE